MYKIEIYYEDSSINFVLLNYISIIFNTHNIKKINIEN